jgi:hypothetical protein
LVPGGLLISRAQIAAPAALQRLSSPLITSD